MERSAALPGPAPGLTRRALASLLLYSSFAFTGGGGDATASECERLVDKELKEVTAMVCTQAYRETGDPDAGYAAARAELALGREDEVLAWGDHLQGTAVEAEWLGQAGSFFFHRQDLDRAADAFERQLELHRVSGDHGLASGSAYWLFYVSWSHSRYRDALRFAGSAYEEALRARDTEKQLLALEALATVLYEVGDLDGAQRIYDRLEELTDPDRARRNRLLVNRGLVQLARGRTALARRAFEQALELADAEDRRFFRSTLINLVKTELIRGDLDAADRRLEQAWLHIEPGDPPSTALLAYRARVDISRGRYREAAQAVAAALEADPVADWAWLLELENGRIAEASGDLKAAEAAYRRAAGIVEELRRSLAVDELKAWLLDKKRQPLEALFRLQVGSGRPLEALATAERGKARTFLDSFVHATGGEAAPEEPEALAAIGRLDSLQALLPAMSASPVVALDPIENVLEALGDRHLLIYFEAGEELWLLAVRNRRVAAHRLPSTLQEAAELVDDFVADLDDPAVAAALSRRLLPPAALPPPGATLHVAAGGALGSLPFAALRRGDRFLVEDYAVAYVPGANALAAIAGRSGEADGSPVVLADAGGDLPEARREAEELAVGLGVVPRTGAAATVAELRQASGARLLHVASHSGLGPRGPWLALADGRVSAAEIVAEGIAPRVAVLASCASAARRSPTMWGSLGGAFLVAGSEAVLASLGSLDDRSARRFVHRFYREGGAREPSRALARTQRAFLAAGEPPAFWAPFVLLGAERSSPRSARRSGDDHH